MTEDRIVADVAGLDGGQHLRPDSGVEALILGDRLRLDPDQLASVAKRFAVSARSFDRRFRLYQYTIKRETAANLYMIDSYFVVLYEVSSHNQVLGDPLAAITSSFSMGKTIELAEEAIHRGAQVLANKVNGFIVQLRDALQLSVATKDEAFTFYRRLLNYDQDKADLVSLQHDRFLDFYVCDSAIECHRDH